MDENKVITRLIQEVREYANGRAKDVARGAETPRLAALLLQKYGQGVIDTVSIIYDSPRAADSVSKVLDEETAKLDPQWRDNNKERWKTRPADIKLM